VTVIERDPSCRRASSALSGQLDPPTILSLDLSALGYDRFAAGRLLREDNAI
jgi:hypothetical protein